MSKYHSKQFKEEALKLATDEANTQEMRFVLFCQRME